MGHLRLGDLPRTRKWQQVVGLIEAGAGTAQVANATIKAAEAGLARAGNDAGLVESVWLLTQLPIAARSQDFTASLREAGLEVSNAPTLLEVTGAFAEAVDRRLATKGARSDLGEMAQMAAVETVTKLVGERMQSLFGTTSEDVRRVFSDLGTKHQFSAFARDFFARFTERYLSYFLSRALPNQVGEGRRFSTLAQQAEFTKALRQHCGEASKIVEEFSGGWFSKTKWEKCEKGGISREDASRFAAYAATKISAELKQGARAHAQ